MDNVLHEMWNDEDSFSNSCTQHEISNRYTSNYFQK